METGPVKLPLPYIVSNPSKGTASSQHHNCSSTRARYIHSLHAVFNRHQDWSIPSTKQPLSPVFYSFTHPEPFSHSRNRFPHRPYPSSHTLANSHIKQTQLQCHSEETESSAPPATLPATLPATQPISTFSQQPRSESGIPKLTVLTPTSLVVRNNTLARPS